MVKSSKKTVIITRKHIQCVLGYSYKTAAKRYREILEYFGKGPKQLLTINDFCTFTGLTPEHVRAMLDD